MRSKRQAVDASMPIAGIIISSGGINQRYPTMYLLSATTHAIFNGKCVTSNYNSLKKQWNASGWHSKKTWPVQFNINIILLIETDIRVEVSQILNGITFDRNNIFDAGKSYL